MVLFYSYKRSCWFSPKILGWESFHLRGNRIIWSWIILMGIYGK